MTGFQSFLLINFEALTTGKPIRTLACVNSTPRVVQSSAPEIDTETMSFLPSPMETSSQLPYPYRLSLVLLARSPTVLCAVQSFAYDNNVFL